MATHGKKIAIWIETTPGGGSSHTTAAGPTGYTQFTGVAHNARLGRNRDTAESTVFGLDDKTYLSGLRSGTLTFDDRYTAAQQAVLTTAFGSDTAVSVIFRPLGNVASTTQFRASYFLTAADIGGNINDVIGGSVNFQRTGAITEESQV